MHHRIDLWATTKDGLDCARRTKEQTEENLSAAVEESEQHDEAADDAEAELDGEMEEDEDTAEDDGASEEDADPEECGILDWNRMKAHQKASALE